MSEGRISEQTVVDIVQAIVADLRNRKGLGDEWDQLEPDIREEIKGEWRHIVREELAQFDV